MPARTKAPTNHDIFPLGKIPPMKEMVAAKREKKFRKVFEELAGTFCCTDR
jgi:hypothetical protein